ncbi:MAG: cytochrome b [Burkholderiales bacterium]
MNPFTPMQEVHSARYTTIAIFLHWLLAVLIFGMVGVGWYMMSIEDEPGSDWYFNIHKSVGILVAVLAALRLIWRLRHKPHDLPKSVTPRQAMMSRVTHWLLYLTMIVMPVIGITGALLSKNGIKFFGWDVPRVIAPDRDLAEIFFDAHSVVAWILVGLIAIHILAALKHFLIDKDDVFQRMWFIK